MKPHLLVTKPYSFNAAMRSLVGGAIIVDFVIHCKIIDLGTTREVVASILIFNIIGRSQNVRQ